MKVERDEGGGGDLGEAVGVEGDHLQDGPGPLEQGVVAFGHGLQQGSLWPRFQQPDSTKAGADHRLHRSRGAAVRELREGTGVAVLARGLEIVGRFAESSVLLDMYLAVVPDAPVVTPDRVGVDAAAGRDR
ncbi:hypothetical protein GCM10009718_33810 [Isoptericola halotolerans]